MVGEGKKRRFSRGIVERALVQLIKVHKFVTTLHVTQRLELIEGLGVTLVPPPFFCLDIYAFAKILVKITYQKNMKWCVTAISSNE